MADAMVTSAVVKAGHQYPFIDDYWHGGRYSKNNINANTI